MVYVPHRFMLVPPRGIDPLPPPLQSGALPLSYRGDILLFLPFNTYIQLYHNARRDSNPRLPIRSRMH